MKKNVMKLITMMLITIVLFTGCKIQSVEDFNRNQLVDSQGDIEERSDELEAENIDKEDKEQKETDKTEVDPEEKPEDKNNNKIEHDALKDKDKNQSKEEKVDVNKNDTAESDKNKTDESTKKPGNNTQTKPNTKPSEKPKPAEKPKPVEKPQPAKQYVTIEIRVDTILKNYDKLDPKLQSEKFVPSSGVILKKTSIELLEGDSVFDILLKATRQNRIHMEYQGGSDNQYGSAYIKGINNIYEFSCGELSGWVYKVNGSQPGHGVSAHRLKGGEAISFNYTCDQGRDI